MVLRSAAKQREITRGGDGGDAGEGEDVRVCVHEQREGPNDFSRRLRNSTHSVDGRGRLIFLHLDWQQQPAQQVHPFKAR